MSDTITTETIRAVAKLARLELEDQEIAGLTEDLQAILGYVAQLDELSLTQTPPTAHPFVAAMPRREDHVAQQSDQAERILSQAPRREGDYFAVPRIIDEQQG